MKKILLLLCLFLDFGFSKQALIVLDPASIEILYMLEREDSILAIANMQNSQIYPKEKTSKLQSVGTFSHPSLEKIIALKPDMVILSSYSLNLKQKLETFGIKTLYLKADNLNEIAQNIKTLGDIVGEEEKAKKLIADYKDKIKNIKKHPLHKKGVLIYSDSPLMVFTPGTLPDDILQTLGITNIAKDVAGARPILSEEFILKENPEIILYGLRVRNQNDLLRTNPLLSKTKAAKNARIYYINAYSLLRGTPRIIDNIIKIQTQFNSIKN
ncbi:ABC transporter substrate-binding protein [Helicobacter sp. 11S03491-1]|uniref:ABC transporter substrate-binding protein n=1 Tax=Helicobacter sp. 11S03491-1 TaxID=1476196 RepID=UPI000BA77D0C|nr:ABC transporter substrate-binding protein [Helicobacter sp. 11S03491-1]PAF43293.1 hypothetical protein BKH45_01245 [Helicobacter sp. 11S03491-1]